MKKFYYILITFVMCICTVTLTTSCSKTEMEEAEKYANNGNNGNNGTLANGEITFAMLKAETNRLVTDVGYYSMVLKPIGCNTIWNIRISENGDINVKDSDAYGVWWVLAKLGEYKIYRLTSGKYKYRIELSDEIYEKLELIRYISIIEHMNGDKVVSYSFVPSK